MASNRKLKKSDLKELEVKEMKKLVSDLKNMVQNLSTVVTCLERRLTKFESTVSDNEEGFQSAGEETPENHVSVLKRTRSLQIQNKHAKQHIQFAEKKEITSLKLPEKYENKKIVKQESVTTEAINETVVNAIELNNLPSVVKVRDIKKKFEFNNQPNHVSSGGERDLATISEDTNIKKEITVNVRNLKQKFESEGTETEGATHDNLAIQEIRRKSEDKTRTEQVQVPEEYGDKIRRILKYFQPKSK